MKQQPMYRCNQVKYARLVSASAAAVLASDGERDGTVEQLRTARVEGRLTVEGFDERVDRALRAVHRYELDRLTADLPQRPAGGDAPSGALAWPWVALISLVMFAIPFGGLVVMFAVIWPSAPGGFGGVGGVVWCVVAWLSLAFLTTSRSQKR